MIELIYDFTTKLQNISGRNDKESFIKQHKDVGVIKNFLRYTLDPMLVYGIQNKKLNKYLTNTEPSKSFQNLLECFEYLVENNTGKDEDVKRVASYINSEDEKYHDFLIKSITKSLKLGANVKTINKALGEELLTEFNVMLAHPFDKYADKIEGKVLYATEKLDGMRVIAFKHGNKIDFRTRQGQQLLGLEDIEKDLLQFDFDILDGEILIKNAEQFKDRAVLQETLKISRKDGIKKGLDFWIFDTITHDDFKSGKSALTYAKRREVLDSLPVNELENVHVLPVLYKGKDIGEIQKILKELEDKGLEGIMLNVANSLYTLSRSSGILKMKTFAEFDEKICEFIEGEGRLKNTLGAIKVMYKGKYPLMVGSGYTDSQRDYLWKHKDELIGRVITIQYFRESENQQGGLSVSFPVFIALCEEGKETSYN